MISQQLPGTCRALVQTAYGGQPEIQQIPTPQPTPGSAVVRILAANILPYMWEIYSGERQYPYPNPLVLGTMAIGRVAVVGPDATTLAPGQLVHVNCVIRGRDDPNIAILHGIHQGLHEGGKKLIEGEWRHSTYAEYAKVPLESCDVLDEKRLLGKREDGGLGYSIENLSYISTIVVPYGGLRDIEVKAGETVVIAPATGGFGGAAVRCAVAIGARVIAMGRNVEVLKKLAAQDERIETVRITGDLEGEAAALRKFGTIDAFFDISPPAAAESTHIKSCITSLRPGGRVSLMGGLFGDVPFPHGYIMFNDLTVKGKWMYDRPAVKEIIKMVEVGVLKIGERGNVPVAGRFELDDWKAAFETSAANSGPAGHTCFVPSKE